MPSGNEKAVLGWTPFARLRFGVYTLLPIASVLVIWQEKWKVPAWLCFFAAIGLLVTAYLYAAILVTEEERQPRISTVFRWLGVIVFVMIASGFSWRAWIVEQMLVEIGAVSVAIAAVAVRKASEEGGIFHGPWLMVMIVFVLPAVGVIFIAWIAVAKFAEISGVPVWMSLALMGSAVVLAVTDATRKLARFTLGDRMQLEEPFGGGPGIVFLILWFFALLIGMPWLLRGE